MKRVVDIALFLSICILCATGTDLKALNTDSENNDAVKLLLESDNDELDSLVLLSQKILKNNHLDSAINLAKVTLRKSNEALYLRGAANSLMLLAEANRKKERFAEALDYYFQAEKELEKLQDGKSLFDLSLDIGLLYEEWGVHKKALEYFTKAYGIKNYYKDLNGEIYALEHIAKSHKILKDNHNALVTYQKLLEAHQSKNDLPKSIAVMSNICDLYSEMEQIEKALEHNLQILGWHKLLKDSVGMTTDYNNIGYLHRKLNNNKEALRYFKESLAMSRQIGGHKPSLLDENVQLVNIGVIHRTEGDLNKALTYFNEALNNRLEEGEPSEIAKVYSQIAYSYYLLNESEESISYADIAIRFAKEAGDRESLAANYKILSEMYQNLYDNQKALKYYKLHITIKDSLLSAERHRREELLQKQIEIEKKETELRAAIIDKELKELALKELRVISSKKENDIVVLKRDQELKDVRLQVQQAEKDQALQELQLTQQLFESQKKAQKITLLQKDTAITNLRLRQGTAEEEARKKEIALLNHNKELQNAELEKEKTLKYFFIGMIALLIIISLLILISYYQKRKANDILTSTLNKLRATQSQLIQSEKMASLGQLTAGIAHEINNPINFVYAGVNGLKESLNNMMEVVNKYEEIEPVATAEAAYPSEVIEEVNKLKKHLYFEETKSSVFEVVNAIEEGALRTAKIVDGLRNFSRLDETELKMADIHVGLDNTLVLLNSKIKGSRVKVHKNYTKRLQEINCYPGQLNQVFMNIISNALEATPEKGNIWIETKSTNSEATITIKDDGPGMSDEVKNRVFEPFYTTKDFGKGTGLGLSISFGIIQKHQGTISLEDNKPSGAKFIISIPKNLS